MSGQNEITEEQRIKHLVERRNDLIEKKAIAGDRLERARDELANAKEASRDKFGTDDPEKLAVMLKKSKAENKIKIEKFEADLSKIEEKLKNVDERSQNVVNHD